MQTLIFGLSQGAIYALMALAIGIVFSTTRIVNFCHADIVMFGAMMSYSLVVVNGFSYNFGVLFAIFLNAIICITVYFVCIKHIGKLSVGNNWMITLFGFGIILKNIARILFGDDVNVFPYLFNGRVIRIGNINIMLHELVMIGSAIIIGVVYEFICQKTKYGKAIRAVSFNPNTAKLMGINSEAITIFCFAIAGGIAAYAGALIAPITFASYSMTSSIGLKGYCAALIGGLGNTKGSFVGGFILGIIECIITLFIPAGYKDAISFVIMILVIMFLPGGILNAGLFTQRKFAE